MKINQETHCFKKKISFLIAILNIQVFEKSRIEMTNETFLVHF